MAKFKIEVELDFIDEKMKIDDVIKKEIISGLQEKFTDDLTVKLTGKLEKIMEEKAKEVVDKFIEKTLKAKFSSMLIPTKTDRFDSVVEYIYH